MSEGLRPTSGGQAKFSQPTPKLIDAHSQSRNSFARIVVTGIILGLLCITLGIALYARPENVKDIILAIVALGGYLAGSRDSSKKELS